MDQVIPLTNAPQQSISVALSVGGNVLKLRLRISFSEMAQYWTMDIADAAGNRLLSSLPLVTGDWPAANVLAQYAYLGIGSAYVVNAGQVAMDYPDSTNLGSDFVLLWGDTAA